MITIQSKIDLDSMRGKDVYNFFINPTDHAYQNWWPGTHLEFHYLRHKPNHIGSVIYMDEWVGKYRLRAAAVVVEVVPGRKIVWHFQKGIRVPVRLALEFTDHTKGMTITHTLQAGFQGLGAIFDPLFRIYFSDKFARALDEHAQIEFPRLQDILSFAKLDP